MRLLQSQIYPEGDDAAPVLDRGRTEVHEKRVIFYFFSPDPILRHVKSWYGANALLSIISFNASLRRDHGKSRYMANGVHER